MIKFFDGPLGGVRWAWPYDTSPDKLVVVVDKNVCRYECDQIDEVFDTRHGHLQEYRMVLSRNPESFDEEMNGPDVVTVNRAALVKLVKAAQQVLDADVWWKTEADLRAALAPFADLQE